ncbi:hypothetical protein ElyMa_004929100 [Elysia marginata]|uniref:Uncharacterized protein n=1 Tax=Elysia marginata TaxID=1093978 RepID=A0AAV4IYS4_9GAST|nr:hypothetical protein ElyMa_004929100 [Elysia marginata]
MDFDNLAFNADLLNIIPSIVDSDDMVVSCNSELKYLLDRHAPIKSRSVTSRPSAPWMSLEIKQAKAERRQAERKWLKEKLTIYRQLFCSCKLKNRRPALWPSVKTLAQRSGGHVTNESVRELVIAYVGPQEPLLATVKRRKLTWFGYVTRHDSLSKTILQGTVEGKRRRGRQKKAWCDNLKEWTGMAMYELVRSASDRYAWRHRQTCMATENCFFCPQIPPTTPQVEGMR